MLERGDQVGLKSVRNLDSVHVLAVDQAQHLRRAVRRRRGLHGRVLATLTASSGERRPALAATVEKADKAEKPAKVENAEKPAKAEKAASLVDAAEAAP